jgi:signal transduction histidine kinase
LKKHSEKPEESLAFSHGILVYLHVEAVINKRWCAINQQTLQMKAQTRSGMLTRANEPVRLANPRCGKSFRRLLTLPPSGTEASLRMDLNPVVTTPPSPEVIEERNRMAREIHDTLAQQFAGILLNLEAVNGFEQADWQIVSECLARARELARSGLEDARRMLLGLRPKPLEAAQLSQALAQLAERFSGECGISCIFGAKGGTQKLPDEVENELYRVAQEALCNVRKHSCAHSVSLSLSYTTSGVTLTIKDNGQGFTTSKQQAGTHGFGLPTMYDRAHRLGGRMDLNTGPGLGTEIRMEVPLVC